MRNSLEQLFFLNLFLVCCLLLLKPHLVFFFISLKILEQLPVHFKLLLNFWVDGTATSTTASLL
jgi:hypothetical protein